MRRYKKVVLVVAALALIAAACGTGEEEAPTGAPDEGIQRGGTFRAALLGDVAAAFDPQKEYYSVTWGLYRCCLLRTLVSYPSAPAGEGGNELVPDLAEDLPEVSEDGLTYTFTIKEGINFAPPFDDTEITADAFVNALEREADPQASSGGYSYYYSIIEGFDDFADGKADTITGVNAPDDHTLEITLAEESGTLPFLMAMHATAPIPDGAAEGHVKDYGRFLVASGPYMFEGSEDLDFDAPPKQQEPVSGYKPNRSITLVRNPSWDKETDDIRNAYVDRIELPIGGTEEDIARKIEAGDLDINLDGVPPARQIRQFQADPDRKDQVFSFFSDAVRYISFNLAEPPFDDVAVRKAVNLAIDKEGLRRVRGGPLFGDIAGHIMIPTILPEDMADYDPYETPNAQGDPDAAKEAMAESKYDKDGDGVCDDAVCKNVLAATDEADPYPDQSALIQDNLKPLGITLDVRSFERNTMYDTCLDPGTHTAICLAPGWGKDFPDATTFAEPLFGAASIGPDSCCNYSLVGAPADVLKEHDYEVTSVPSVDDKIDECEPLTGDERLTCWGELDQQLMEEVVPWVPYLFDKTVDVVSDRVQNYTYEQFSGQIAFDQVALRGGGEE